MNKALIYCFFLIFIVSCTSKPKVLTPTDYLRWFEENKKSFLVDRDISGINYQLQYLPQEYLLVRNALENKLLLDSILNTNFRHNRGSFLFRIGLSDSNTEILNYNLSSKNDYDSRINYYSFEMKKDLVMVVENDTIGCMDCVFERTYGLTPYITLNLFFEQTKETDNTDIQIIYYDRVFNNGRIKLILPKEKLEKLPMLKTNKL